MNELKQFNFENNQVRTLLINDEPWFVGKDVAEILGYSNPRDALSKHVDSEDKNSVAIHDGNKGNPNLTIINESGVYALVFSSKLQSAKKFKHWVTSEVLPTLRKTGSYATPQLTGEELMAKALIEAKSVLERQNKQIIEMKPKALFADTVAASDSSILVGQEAKLISQSGCKMGQNRFFAWLRENGYLCSKGENYNMPTQKSREMDLIEIKIRTVTNPDGSVRETKTPVITGKGQIYFINKFKNA
ncbi:phage antirepressor [Holdemanella porci]|jgi:anti-repressor protein|uniref:phage antirepressor n=1 Tax=Holdemanella porci TaxID=2652276 RepID=UPI002943EE96|nr:phage antirepressor [Holdemanella porci]